MPTSVFTGPSVCLPAMLPKAFRVATEMTLPLRSGSVTTISGSGGFFEMTRVFISYRRDDTAGQAGRVHDRLTGEFGDNNVFMDVDNIPLGADFTKVLGDEVAKCDVLLAMIGPNWLNAYAEDGSRRLDNPDDFVRTEIATALQRDIPVIPILLDGGRVPKSDQLPSDLKRLARRNALEVRHTSFRRDLDKLIRGLKAQPRRPTPQNEGGSESSKSASVTVLDRVRGLLRVSIQASSARRAEKRVDPLGHRGHCWGICCLLALNLGSYSVSI